MSGETEHLQVQEWLGAYVAGGLSARERAAVELHVAACEACAAQLREVANMDSAVMGIFDGVAPAAGFEDRIVKRLEGARRAIIFIHPAVRRAAAGIAAAVVLGAAGYFGGDAIQNNRLPWAALLPSATVDRDPHSQAWGTVRWGGAPATRPMSSLSESLGGDLDTPAKAAEARYRQALAIGAGPGLGDLGRKEKLKASSSLATDAPQAEEARLNKKMDTLDRRLEEKAEGVTELSLFAVDYVNDWSQTDAPDGASSARGGSVPTRGINGVSGGGFGTAAVNQPAPTDLHFTPGQPVSGPVAGRVTAGVEVKKLSEEVALKADGTGVERFYFKPADAVAAVGDRKLSTGKPVQAATELAKDARAMPALVTADQAGRSSEREGGGGGRQGQPAEPTSGQTVENPQVNQQQQQGQQQQRKIIRNGQVEFEVDSFDSSFMQITKIVQEESGFVSSTSSEKLPNGKVRGTIVVRVPPDRLDTLVLKLRALGDLRSQRISAQDVTKVYYDLESELRAARAMEERLLNIIKSGKGEIKDLLEAEKQLGVYREKIEKLEGEVRYYNNLVSLSTLNITLTERDIKSSALASQTENVQMGIETEDVEKSRADAIKAIDEAKGRIIESNLKKHDAGQLAATIVADVSPDAAGPVIDRLKQLGRVARLDIERRQSAPGEIAPAITRVERKDTRLSISIYNLANIAPRQTTNLNMAVANVEEAYRSIVQSVQDRKGRIVTSNLNRQKPEQTTATISFEVPSADAEATLAEIRRDREVMSLSVTENPDTQNVTAAKRGFVLQIHSLATVPARETESQVLATRGRVADTFRAMLDVLRTGEARILVSQLNNQDANNVSGQLDFEVQRAKEPELRQALGALAESISRSVTRSSDDQNTVDSKIRMQVRLLSIDRIAPRDTQALAVATADVPVAYQALLGTLQELGSRIIASQLNESDPQNVTATLDFEVFRDLPRGAKAAFESSLSRMESALKEAGVVYSRSVSRATDTQNTIENKVRMIVQLANVTQLTPRQHSKLMLEVADVDGAAAQVLSATASMGGQKIASTQARSGQGQVSGHLVVVIPLDKGDLLREAVRKLGTLRVSETREDWAAPGGQIGRARFEITFATADRIVTEGQGIGAALRNALSISASGLFWSVQMIVVGLLFVGPWALVLWGLWKLARRRRAATA